MNTDNANMNTENNSTAIKLKNAKPLNKTDIKYPYLKKGAGKLASQFHGETAFAKQRKLKIIREQEAREADYKE